MSDLIRSERQQFPAPPAVYSQAQDTVWQGEPEESDDSLSVREMVGLVRRNLVLVLAITAAVAAVAAFVVMRTPPVYRALAVIRLSDARSAVSGGLADPRIQQVMGRTADPLLSELEVLKGRVVLGEVVDREGLRVQVLTPGLPPGKLENVVVTSPPQESDTAVLRFGRDDVSLRVGAHQATTPYGTPVEAGGVRLEVAERPEVEEATLAIVPRERAIDLLSRNLSATPRKKTDAIQVEYASTDPVFAQRVVNATIGVFQAANARAAQQQSRSRRIFLEEQLRATDSVLTEAQIALSDFRRREGVFSSQERFAAQQEGLMQLQVRREELLADRRMYGSLLEKLSGSGAVRARTLRAMAAIPEVSGNPVAAHLYEQLGQYQSARDSLTAGPLGSTSRSLDVQSLDGLIAATEVKLVDALRSHLAVLDGRLAMMDDLVARNATQIRASPDAEAEEVRLLQQVLGGQKVADQIREELQKARMAEAVEVGQVEVVYPAPLPTTSVGIGKGTQLGLGLLLGLMLGGTAAFLRERMDTAIRGQDQIRDVLRVPGLALIPRIQPRDGAARRLLPGKIGGGGSGADGLGLVTLNSYESSGAEAYRTLRTNLIFSQAVRTLRTLVVTSSTPSEGKTTTSANLAVTYAQQGMRVLLVDCDLRRARLHKVFRAAREPGLTQLLMGQVEAAEAFQSTPVEGLLFMPAGALPPNPAELLGGGRMRELLESVSEEFDLVILDTPPLMAASDAAVLGSMTDGVIIVVRAGMTDRTVAQRAVGQLNSVGANVLGAVLNDPDARAAAYGERVYEYYGESA